MGGRRVAALRQDAQDLGLLCKAKGAVGPPLDAGVAVMLTDRGRGTKDRAGVSPRDARDGARATVEVLATMSTRPNVFRDVDPELVARLARAALFGTAAS